MTTLLHVSDERIYVYCIRNWGKETVVMKACTAECTCVLKVKTRSMIMVMDAGRESVLAYLTGCFAE